MRVIPVEKVPALRPVLFSRVPPERGSALLPMPISTDENYYNTNAKFESDEQKNEEEDVVVVVDEYYYKIPSSASSSSRRLVDKSKMKMIKKLRLMLQSGAPLEVVKRRAFVENIDMDLVLLQQQSDDECSVVHSKEGGGTTSSSSASSASSSSAKKKIIVSPILLKKYIRMYKMGVGIAQVQQLAFIEAKLKPDEVVALLELQANEAQQQNKQKKKNKAAVVSVATVENDNKDNEEVESMMTVAIDSPTTTTTATRHTKYERMLKAGLPLAAIYRTAEVDGVMKNPKDLDFALGINSNKHKENENTTKPSTTTTTTTISNAHNNNNGDNNNGDKNKVVDDNDEEKEKDEQEQQLHYFTMLGLNKISLDENSTLAALVRKMSHSVDKTMTSRSRGNNSSSCSSAARGTDCTMVVDMLTLYHALGSFKGVQVSRDDYNSTCDAVIATATTSSSSSSDGPGHRRRPSIAWLKAKRQSFQEIIRSIGMKASTDLVTKVDIPGLDDLIAIVQKRFKNEIHDIHNLLGQGFYDFDSLAVMYPPGERVVAKNAGGGGVDMICKVAWNRYQQGKTIMGQPTKYFQVCFEYVVAVGSNNASIAECVEGMEMFEGRRSLLGGLLQFIPWSAYGANQQQALLQRYRRRGCIYNQVALNLSEDENVKEAAVAPSKSFSYKQYQQGCFFLKRGGGGGTLVGGGSNPSLALSTGGRIIIDNQGAMDYGYSLSIGYDPMITGIQYKVKEYKLQLRGDAHQKHDNGGNHHHGHHKHSDDAGDGSGMVLFDRIPDDYLEFVWPCVVGFSLSAKAWGDCLVDGLEDIIFSGDVFDKLVLPAPRKRLVKALVKNSSGGTGGDGFQDLIAGKGEGTVFLLYGPPGVGKTLTAEAVAEVLKRPLFSVSMGTLGTTADELERRLGEILKLSAKWDAVILLDEADSFLETRSSASSMERNAMVSVMLKLVEYFSGILFLTSNRFDSLDPAFQTRITLSLAYENLDANGREKIWENLLSRSGIPTIDIDINELASSFSLNGREIKNALRLAMALAIEENRSVSHDILMETSAMIKPVDKRYMARNGNNCFSLFGWLKK